MKVEGNFLTFDKDDGGAYAIRVSTIKTIERLAKTHPNHSDHVLVNDQLLIGTYEETVNALIQHESFTGKKGVLNDSRTDR